jgi:hypothetical protein
MRPGHGKTLAAHPLRRRMVVKVPGVVLTCQSMNNSG